MKYISFVCFSLLFFTHPIFETPTVLIPVRIVLAQTVLQVEPVIVEPEVVIEQEPEEPKNFIACSCIKTARSEGVDIPIGTNAVDLKPNSRPVIGGLILLKYENVSHVAVIKEFTNSGFLVVEGNFNECQREEREIYFIDPFIIGFYQV